MVYMYKDDVEHELDKFFPIELLEAIDIEFMNIPRNVGQARCLLNDYGIITLDIKNGPREKLKNALTGAIFLSPENFEYTFADNSFQDNERESQIDDLVEKIMSEPSSLIFEEMGYMIKRAEIKYIERLGGNFEYH